MYVPVKNLLIFLVAGVVLASDPSFLGRFLEEVGVCTTVEPRNFRMCSSFSANSSAKASSA